MILASCSSVNAEQISQEDKRLTQGSSPLPASLQVRTVIMDVEGVAEMITLGCAWLVFAGLVGRHNVRNKTNTSRSLKQLLAAIKPVEASSQNLK